MASDCSHDWVEGGNRDLGRFHCRICYQPLNVRALLTTLARVTAERDAWRTALRNLTFVEGPDDPKGAAQHAGNYIGDLIIDSVEQRATIGEKEIELATLRSRLTLATALAEAAENLDAMARAYHADDTADNGYALVYAQKALRRALAAFRGGR